MNENERELRNRLELRAYGARSRVATNLSRAELGIRDALDAMRRGQAIDYDSIQTRLDAVMTDLTRATRNAAIAEIAVLDIEKLNESS